MHGERGEPYWEVVDQAFVFTTSLAADDGTDVRRRAAHVERERVLEAGELGKPRCSDDTRRRAGEKSECSMCCCLVQRRQPS
jgi:hypothetical protein